MPQCVFLSSVDPTDQKKTACYDIDVEVDDPLKGQMNSFLSSTTNQQEIAALEMKVWLVYPHRSYQGCIDQGTKINHCLPYDHSVDYFFD